MRIRVSLAMAVAVLLAATPALATVRDIPRILGSELGRVTAYTEVPVLLPQTMPFAYGGTLYPYVRPSRTGWQIYIDKVKDCYGGGGSCFAGYFWARSRGKIFNQIRVNLRDGKPGYFRPSKCGASCSSATIEFKRDGVIYEFTGKYSKAGRTDKQILVAAANSALKAGPR